MTSAEEHAKPSRAAPASLWRAMRAFLCLLFDMFGEPSDIAATGLFGRRSRALLMPWLRAGEAFLRRLLFIEALALREDARVLSAPNVKRAARKRVRKLQEFFPDKPQDWRVSFRLLPSARTARRSGGRCRMRRPALALPSALIAPRFQRTHFTHAPAAGAVVQPRHTPRAPRDPDNAWPMAERLEALLRAYNAPHASALRLARMLQRDEQRALRTLRPEPAHIVDRFGAPTFVRCNAIVASRRRKWDRAHARPGGD